MAILNLVYKEKTEVIYDRINYPDGQNEIIIKGVDNEGFHSIDDYFRLNCENIVDIYSRFNNFLNLEEIICTTKALRRLGVKEIHLYIPYLLGARSDRKFVEGGTSYLVDIIAPIINSLEFDSVTVMDVHSDVAAACINNLKVLSNIDLIKWVFMNHPQNTKSLNDMLLISPDGGSLKKIYKVADTIGYKGDVICCSKSRDNDGKLSKTIVPYSRDEDDLKKDYIIIDDICDGGNTFINIAKEIKKHKLFTGKIYLIVTHGIFSQGFDELSKYFDGIYCTNSYRDIKHMDVFKDVNSYMGTKNYIKQLNVF